MHGSVQQSLELCPPGELTLCPRCPSPESPEAAVLRPKSLTVLDTTVVDVSGIIRYLSFGDWLPSFSIIRFAPAVACAGFPF